MYPSPNKAMNRPPLGPSSPGSFQANQPGQMNQNGEGPSNPYKGGSSSTMMHPPSGMNSGALSPPMTQPVSGAMLGGENPVPEGPPPMMGGPMDMNKQAGMMAQHAMQPMQESQPSMPPPPSPYQRQDIPSQVQKQRKLVPQSQ